MLNTFKQERIKQILVISSPNVFRLFPKYFPNWIKERKKLGVSARTLLREDAKKDPHFLYNEEVLREVRYFPAHIKFTGTMNIYGNKIALFSHDSDEPISIIIDSLVLTEMMKQFFNFTWSLLKG